MQCINPLNVKLNPICHLLALLGAHHILHVSRIRVNVFRRILKMSSLNVLLIRPMKTGYILCQIQQTESL